MTGSEIQVDRFLCDGVLLALEPHFEVLKLLSAHNLATCDQLATKNLSEVLYSTEG